DDAGTVDSSDAGTIDSGTPDDQDAGSQPSGWLGPTARIETVPYSNETFLTIDGTHDRPIYVSVNPQAITDDAGWQTLLAEVDLASQQGMPIIDLMLGNHSINFLQQLSSELGDRQVYLWLRFDIWIPELANVGVPVMNDLAGDSQAGYRQTYAL